MNETSRIEGVAVGAGDHPPATGDDLILVRNKLGLARGGI
jgi:hypothetical protein